ncbi:hypothetical protein QE152_g295 [Popillia japonica]|uniref:Uncharacterized protein n=1 Tax=Popillia japonica TaxID=7064 RepID=A0AAW1NBY4_POPJA
MADSHLTDCDNSEDEDIGDGFGAILHIVYSMQEGDNSEDEDIGDGFGAILHIVYSMQEGEAQASPAPATLVACQRLSCSIVDASICTTTDVDDRKNDGRTRLRQLTWLQRVIPKIPPYART